MYRPNFCAECGERLARQRWRLWRSPRFCGNCTGRLGRESSLVKPLATMSIVAISAFGLGRYMRPPSPPLVIQRAANSPLSDLPVNLNDATQPNYRREAPNPGASKSSVDEPGYICGARTKKGSPCHRRVHVAGERCFQHKGMTAILPLEKLVIKDQK